MDTRIAKKIYIPWINKEEVQKLDKKNLKKTTEELCVKNMLKHSIYFLRREKKRGSIMLWEID
jgi:hypothetical protein